MIRTLWPLLVCASLACVAHPLRPVSTARPIDLPGYPKDQVFRDQATTFAGQPSESALRAAAATGHHLVINLRTQAEVEALPFDESALVESLGMRHVSIPVSPKSFSRADVELFARSISESSKPILIHCSSSNRAGAMWAAYLALHRGMTEEEALEKGRAAGLSKEEMIEATLRVLQDTPGGW